MSDPVTIGVLAASVLAMAGEAVVKSSVGEVVKDAYAASGKLGHFVGGKHWEGGTLAGFIKANPV